MLQCGGKNADAGKVEYFGRGGTVICLQILFLVLRYERTSGESGLEKQPMVRGKGSLGSSF